MITFLKVITVYMTDDVSREVSNCVAEIDGVQHSLRDKSRGDALANLGNGEQPDVVIYQMKGASEIEYDEICGFIEAHQNKTTVIIVRKEADAESTRRLMRAGARDVLPFPMNMRELTMLLIQCFSEKRQRITDEHGNLAGTTVFMNAKGGCGATTIALNTACSLVRNHKAKVALLDFDIQLGDVALYLDLKPQATIIEALLQSDRLDPVFLESLMTKHSSGVDVLAAPSNLESLSEINPADISKVLETMAEAYDFVIIDMPALITPWTIEVLKFSEHIMLVLQNSLSTIKNAKVIMRSLPEMGIAIDKLELVNNRAMSKTHNVDIAKLKSALGREKIHRIRNDFNAVLASQDQGVALHELSSNSKICKDINHIADYIWTRQQGPDQSKLGFFSKIFSHKQTQASSSANLYH